MPKLLATDGEGERLDRFELVAELASGGMATVYLARLSGVAGFQRLVAIKRLHPHLAKEPEFMEMFLDEARLAARIHHPNVVPIQEVGESPEGYYLVMDYVDGDTLARLLSRAAQKKAQIPWAVTIRILLDTLAGLHAAHELKDDFGAPLAIVHRDVSPQNILVGTDGIARLTDFGVARAATRLATTRSGQLKGKLSYMAPEQARGDSLDRRADIFSCGIVLWEALALKRLFKTAGEAQTLNRVLFDPIPPPSVHRADVPQSLEALCMRALERDVEKRFPTALDFADELESAARALSCVGSARDVAACLETVFGSDLANQRDAVRAWLARSEPSATRSRPSLPGTGPQLPKARAEGSSSRVPPEPETVSSVSSAIVSNPESSGVVAPPPPRPLRARDAVLIAAAAVVVVAAVFWGATRFRGEPPSPPAAAPTASVAATVVPTASVLPAASAPPVASSAAVASDAAPAASSAKLPRKPVVAPKPPEHVVPDDLSKNPYR